MKRLLLVGCIVCLGAWCAGAQEQTKANSSRADAPNSTNIAPRAAEILRNACQYLAEAPFFGITAEVWREHVNEAGEKLQFTRMIEMEVKRPDRLHVEINTPHSQRGFWYNGKGLTVLDRTENLFSTTPMPPKLDGALDAAHDDFGIDLPLIDLAVSDPYANAMARVQTAKYFGVAPAMGFNCHHLAFTQENVDWQVWIEDGPQPLIRKFVITHKNEPGAPEFTALIRSWNLSERIADSDFVFALPRGALKIQMRKDLPQNEESNGNKAAAAPSAAAPTGR